MAAHFIPSAVRVARHCFPQLGKGLFKFAWKRRYRRTRLGKRNRHRAAQREEIGLWNIIILVEEELSQRGDCQSEAS